MLIWVHRGPKAGEFMDIPPLHAEKAIEDGWAQKPGMDDRLVIKPIKDDHEPAVAYLRDPAAYATRELRASPPGKVPPPKEKPKEPAKKD